jgi:hypothetical protein
MPFFCFFKLFSPGGEQQVESNPRSHELDSSALSAMLLLLAVFLFGTAKDNKMELNSLA